jgi:transcriptional regulator with XRE-family HTH domain
MEHPLTLYRNSYTPPMTRVELATRLGVAPSSVTRWEAGERRPDVEMMARISSVTGISPQELRPDIAQLMQASGASLMPLKEMPE